MKVLKNILAITIAFISGIMSPYTFAADKNAPNINEVKELLDQSISHYRQGDYVKSLSDASIFISRSKDLPEGSISPDDIAYGYLVLGNVNFAFANYYRAINSYEKGLSTISHKGSNKLIRRILHNLSLACSMTNQKEAALRYIKLIDKLPPDNNTNYAQFCRQVRLGVYEKNFGSLRKSISLMKSAIKTAHTYHLDDVLLLTPVSEIFEMYENIGELDSSMVYLKEYDRLARQANASSMIVNANLGFMRLYSKTGDLNKAIEYQNKYFELKDSLLNNSNFEEVLLANSERDSKITDDKIHDLREKVSQQSLLLWILIIGIIILSMLWFTITLRRRLNQTYRMLYKRDREIKSILSNKNHDYTEEKENSGNYDDIPFTEENNKDKNTKSFYPELEEKINRIMTESREFLDPDFSISVLSSLVGFNSKYVSTFINDRYNKNFRAFINSYRIREAIDLFSEEDGSKLTIKKMAEKIGFRSSSNFITAFKKETGLTPSMYFKLSKEKSNS